MHRVSLRFRVFTHALITLAVLASTACGSGNDEASLRRASGAARSALVAPAAAGSASEAVEVDEPTTTTTTAPATTTTTTAPPTTTTTTTAPPARFSVDAYRGLGVWVDVFDWATAYTSNPIGAADIDAMAAQGTQTLYIQTNRYDHPADALEPDRLNGLIARAHTHGMRVVAWYLPTFVDLDTDLRRLLAAAALDVEGIAVDIESLELDDTAERTRRLVDLSKALRAALPGEAIGAIVLEPVVMENVNPNYWPGYPWAEMAPIYDVWLPMSYWTNRVGPWRSAQDYIATNVTRVRERLGQPDAPVHVVGGVGDETTVADLDGMAAAVAATGPIGASIYDYRTTKAEHWAILSQFRL